MQNQMIIYSKTLLLTNSFMFKNVVKVDVSKIAFENFILRTGENLKTSRIEDWGSLRGKTTHQVSCMNPSEDYRSFLIL